MNAKNSKKVFLSLFIFLLILCISCKDKTVEPNESSVALEDAFSIAAQNASLRCLIVFKDDQIIKERYFHPGDSSSAYNVRSVTKSVMATLIGIAIDKGIIPTEEQKIGDYLRLLVGTIDSVKASIKIRDLLTMSSGLSGNDIPDVTEYDNWYNAPNQLEYSLNQPMIHQPGQVFGYNSGASHLTSVILTQAGRISTFQFAKQYLFQTLGIADHSWGTDKDGIYNGGSSLSLTPYDMLKIGQLYLNRGVFNGIRIVSEEWIEKASTFKITTNDIISFGPAYGYFWWIGSSASHEYFFANGFGGQFIVVVPDIRLIVVATNNLSNVSISAANQQWYNTMDVIINRIIPIY